MLNIAILGCGRIGQVHARTVDALDTARVTAVSDALPEAAGTLAKDVSARVMTVEEIFADSSIDGVIIGTPTTTHYDLIHGAAAAGKAILCEKPVDLDAGRIQDCLAVVAEHAVPFMVGFNRRFDTNFANIQHRIAAGEIGSVEIVSVMSRDPSPPPLSYVKTSGGLFRDMMIHDFDMARFLLGEEPVEVYASGAALVDPALAEVGDVDTAVAVLRTASGKLCQITNSRRATYGYDQRVEVHGSKGMLRAENQLETSVEIATADGFQRAPTQHFFLERYAQAYRSELEHFVNCILNGETPLPDGQDGLQAQLLADAATLSAETGERVCLS